MNEYYNPPVNKRCEAMEIAALVLAIISVVSCTCIYVSVICASLSMMFALLSKGGATSMSSRSVASFIISLCAMILTIVMFVSSYIILYSEHGSMKNIINSYSEYTGFDYDDLMKEIDSSYEDE